jgi:CBS domain-containing protein
MRAGDIMTRELITVTPLTTLKEAATLMLQHAISGLPVLNRHTLVGMLTEGDLLRRGELTTERHRSRWGQLFGSRERQAQDYVRAHGQHVAQVMSLDPISITPDSSLSDVVALMESRHVKRLPVLSEGRLVGIVSRADLLRTLIGMLPRVFVSKDDAQIARDLRQQLERQPWAPRAEVYAAVRDGVVELTGTVLHEAERTALRVLATNITGVKRVVDRMLWIDPIGGTVIDLPPVVEDPTTTAAANEVTASSLGITTDVRR